jgi:hypothetical protein
VKTPPAIPLGIVKPEAAKVISFTPRTDQPISPEPGRYMPVFVSEEKLSEGLTTVPSDKDEMLAPALIVVAL